MVFECGNLGEHFATEITQVRPLALVLTQVGVEAAQLNEPRRTLTALVWPLAGMLSAVSTQVFTFSEPLLADRTFETTLARVGYHVAAQVTERCERAPALDTLQESLTMRQHVCTERNL